MKLCLNYFNLDLLDSLPDDYGEVTHHPHHKQFRSDTPCDCEAGANIDPGEQEPHHRRWEQDENSEQRKVSRLDLLGSTEIKQWGFLCLNESNI